jgi:hypothetical protein
MIIELGSVTAKTQGVGNDVEGTITDCQLGSTGC